MTHKQIFRFITDTKLEPLVYVMWDRITQRVKKWDGVNIEDIVGMYEYVDGEFLSVDKPARSAYPGETVIISKYYRS